MKLALNQIVKTFAQHVVLDRVSLSLEKVHTPNLPGIDDVGLIAGIIDANESARLWPKLDAMYPGYIEYRKGTTREIPIVILTP